MNQDENELLLPMGAILRGADVKIAEAGEIPAVNSPFGIADGVIAEDAIRRAAPDTDDWLPDPEPEPALLATPELTQMADVPYSLATSSLGRDIATRMSEAEQRLNEIAADIDAANKAAHELIDSVYKVRDSVVDSANIAAAAMTDQINNNLSQEVAILRGRETDILKVHDRLSALSKALTQE